MGVCVFLWHRKVEPGSLEVKVKVADVLDVVPIGGDVIVVSGATVSIVQAAWAGVESGLQEQVDRPHVECVRPVPSPV